MNLADYLNELLEQHNEVSVPGLGYFVRTRVNAYYNEKEAKFYPPHHQATFIAEPKDDDTFVVYVARKKNISLASAKYFIEKFIGKLKEDAANGSYLFSDLGSFRTEHDQLVFTPNGKLPSDPEFYGYETIDIKKITQPLREEPAKPVYVEPAVAPPVVIEPQVQPTEQEEYYYEEETEGRRVNVWLVVLLSIAAIALGLFGIYEYNPAAFSKLNIGNHKNTGKNEAAAPVHKDSDSAKNSANVKDTSAKVAAPIIDTAKQVHFEILAGRYFHPWQKDQAAAEVERYKGLGLNAKISTDVPGLQIKICVGTYFTQKEADSVRAVLIASGKIPQNSHQLVKINPK